PAVCPDSSLFPSGYSSVLLTCFRPPQKSSLFPYTPLFRSAAGHVRPERRIAGTDRRARQPRGLLQRGDRGGQDRRVEAVRGAGRSEEHTSELQSPDHLVCRLLLEKKKKRMIERN